jgi:hypothetical protein
MTALHAAIIAGPAALSLLAVPWVAATRVPRWGADCSPVLPWEDSPPRVAGQAGPAGDSAQPAGPTTPEEQP